MGNGETAQALVNIIKDHSERFSQDFHWAWLITEAALVCDSAKIYDLIEFGLHEVSQQRPEVLTNIIFGARRIEITVDKLLLNMFASQANDVKMMLVPLLLRSKSRGALQPALEFLMSYISSERHNNQARDLDSILGELKFVNEGFLYFQPPNG